MDASLNEENLDINCKYKLVKGEKFIKLMIKKNGLTFLGFTADNRDGNY